MARRKKLIEVALPLEAINKESAREKSIRHGHPSTLHLWWARRPLAACRAVLFAQFVDDPDSDPAYRKADGSVDEDAAGLKRAQLFNLIEELVKWESSNNERVVNAARAEIARCVASWLLEEGKFTKDTIIHGVDEGRPHPKGPLSGEFRTAWELVVHGHGDLDSLQQRRTRLCPPTVVNHFLAAYAPPVLDPFAGGGSIPLEAQRLGLRAYAADLNPVPVLINKALIEIPPKFANQPPVNPGSQKKLGTARYQGAQGLAEDVRHYGKWMRDEAEKRIGHLYPKVMITKEMAKDRPDLNAYVGQELTVIAWLWARTAKCPNPACRATIPLIRSYLLGTKRGKEAWLKPLPNSGRLVQFAIGRGAGKIGDPPKIGRGASFRCVACGQIAEEAHIRSELRAKRSPDHLICTVTQGKAERVYLPALDGHADLAHSMQPFWQPEVEMNPKSSDLVSGRGYGVELWSEIFTTRQLVSLNSLIDLLDGVEQRIRQDGKAAGRDDARPLDEGGSGVTAYAQAMRTYLALAIGRLANYATKICTWHSGVKYETITSTFGRQALPMTWDYAEGNPFSDSSGNFTSQVNSVADNVERLCCIPAAQGNVVQRDAAASAQPAGAVVSCDPPYYDNIAYADLSDFFYLWMRRALGGTYRSLFSTMLTPKNEELVAVAHRFDGNADEARKFFESGLEQACQHMRTVNPPDKPLAIFYAFKQAETTGDSGTASTGWETFLHGLIQNGFAITGTWPMRTELTGNLKKNVAALASSVVLACVAREADAPMATRREFLNSLKRELPDAMKKLQSGNIAPVDLAQAAIGPGMAAFSRYGKVVESDGKSMTVRAALTLINQVLDEVLAEQEGEFDSDTRWAVAWFEQHGKQEGSYGVAETLSKAKNTSVQGLVDAGVISARGGKVRLIARDAMPDDWDPATDSRMTCWEATQHLIHRLQNEGEESAAQLLARLGGDYGDMARDLAYRLYSICERKSWAQEALAYNSLVIAWSEISKLSRTVTETKPTQADLF